MNFFLIYFLNFRNLFWKNNIGKDICLNYPNIALHAISKDINAFPHECLYIITDRPIEIAGENVELKEIDNDSDDSDEITPLRFVPEDKSLLNPIFKAINECQALYPDEELSDESDESEEEDQDIDENQFFDSTSDLNEIELSDRGHETLKRLNINYHFESKFSSK